jgi:8-oxo-dGTP pyrophosphatase MutT (NUDIX family)
MPRRTSRRVGSRPLWRKATAMLAYRRPTAHARPSRPGCHDPIPLAGPTSTQPTARRLPRYRFATMREAAVLVPVYRVQDRELVVVLVRRGEGGIYGGQLALPGGQRDPGDVDLAATALREAEEELGLTSDRVELLAALPVVETQTTGFRITPSWPGWPCRGPGAFRSGRSLRWWSCGSLTWPGPRSEPRRSVSSRPGRRRGASDCGDRPLRGLGSDLPDPGAAGPAAAGQ